MNEAIQRNLGVHISEMNTDPAGKETSLAKSDYYPNLTLGANGIIIDERALKSFGSTAERTLSSNLNRILNRKQNDAFRAQVAALEDQILKVYSADKI